MNLLIILVLCILSTAKVTIQGKFAKNNIVSFSDACVFNALMFLFSALIFLKDMFSLTFPVFLFGAVFGILTVLFQGCYIKAMSCGNVSLTVLIVSLSMIIPVMVSVFGYGEGITALRFLGIALTVLSLVLSVDNKGEKQNLKIWFCLSVLSALLSGSLAVCQKIFSKTEWGGESKTFVSCSYAVAAVVSIVIYLILKLKREKLSYKVNLKVIGFALSIGVVLGVFQVLYTKAIGIIDGTLIFPTYYGGSLLLSYISSILILKEKIKAKQKLSFAVGIIAIVFMNM